MHNSRLFALVGVGIAVIGLFVKGLRTAGEGLLTTLSQSDAGFPDGLPTIWGGSCNLGPGTSRDSPGGRGGVSFLEAARRSVGAHPGKHHGGHRASDAWLRRRRVD